MYEIKAIETLYAGIKFRSRLEARWAVFFDSIGLDWVYEPERFELGNGSIYTPDFLLRPKIPPYLYESNSVDLSKGFYVEVKPNPEHFNDQIKESILHSVDWNGPCSRLLIILGEIPRENNGANALHIGLTHIDRGVRFVNVVFTQHGTFFSWCEEERFTNTRFGNEIFKWDFEPMDSFGGFSNDWSPLTFLNDSFYIETDNLPSSITLNNAKLEWARANARTARFGHHETITSI